MHDSCGTPQFRSRLIQHIFPPDGKRQLYPNQLANSGLLIPLASIIGHVETFPLGKLTTSFNIEVEVSKYETQAAALVGSRVEFALLCSFNAVQAYQKLQDQDDDTLGILRFIYETNTSLIIVGRSSSALSVEKWSQWILATYFRKPGAQSVRFSQEEYPYLAFRLAVPGCLFKFKPTPEVLSAKMTKLYGFSRSVLVSGDVVTLVYGYQCPLILRPLEGTDQHTLIGWAVVDGVMKREAVGILPKIDLCIR